MLEARRTPEMPGPDDAEPQAAPHENGHANGYHIPLGDGRPALVATCDEAVPQPCSIVSPPVPSDWFDVGRELLASLPADARRRRLTEYFRERVAAVLGLPADKVDPDKTLISLGLDSLSAMDLKLELDARLGTPLPLSMFLESSGIHELAENATALLAESPTRSIEPVVDPTSGVADLRLSHEQQLLWYADQFSPNRAAYHITGAATVRAKLDQGAFRRALGRVIARQDALRTTFAIVDEKPTTRVLPPSEIGLRDSEWLPIEDVAGRSDHELRLKLAELARQPFDLERGPLFRIHILSRSESEHIVLLVVHHIIADFWSTAVLVDDLGKEYAAELAGRESSLSQLDSRYVDFVQWQHAMLASSEGEGHWDYWRQQLKGPLPVLELPTDFARPPVRTYRGATRYFYLDPALTRGIVALSESQGASLYTTLLAAFQILLGRLSGQDDIIVGSPVSGRTRPGLEGLIGYFVNLIPMRADLSANPGFDEFLGRVRRTVADGLEHQDFPFSLLVNRLHGNPDPSRPPLFQVMFAHQKAQRLDEQGLAPFALGVSGARLSLLGLTAESLELDRQTALFDLTMMTARQGDRLCVALEYSTDLFRAVSIDRMVDYFRTLLESLVANPGCRLADLVLIPEKERHQLLKGWATTPAITHSDVAIHHRFERQAERSPESLALVSGEESFTYDRLNRLSNVFAHRLIGLGVTPETVVGLYLDRWPSRVIALLGALKAGGAYLPLDPDHPVERVATMLKDSGAKVVVTDGDLHERLPEPPAITLDFDSLTKTVGDVVSRNPRVPVDGDNLAYVVFTSGSTGRPKGVMVSHGSLLAAASGWERAYSLKGRALRHLQAAGFAFDVFTGDWVRALSTGGTLVGCPRSVLLDPASLADLIRRQRIECVELVPAVAELLAGHVEHEGEDLAGIRLLAVGSDMMRGRLYRRLRRLVGAGGRVVNSYGLTEATIDSTYFGGPHDEFEGDGPVPIGRPLPATRIYVLDANREPVPPGVVGELYVGGPGVARGYVNNPGQTALRFMPDPHGEPGSRIYATGDRARWRANGLLEMLGRQDGQVKVRGFRVELGEVESVLARHPQVREAVATVVEDGLEAKRLVAYLVPASTPGPKVFDLRRWLKDRLPEPMIPSAYVILESLPLSPNGKVDRAALPGPDPVECETSETYVHPRTGAEHTLAGITAELVGRTRVGIFDNFFEIGVDSIIGIQVISRARQAGLLLDPADLFRHPTVAELAATAEATLDHHDANTRSKTDVAPFELVPAGVDLELVNRTYADDGGIEDLYPLTPAQEGMLFHSLADPEAGHYVEQFVCRLRGTLDHAALKETCRRLVARHPALRSTIHWSDFDQRFQVVHRQAELPIDYQDWRELKPAEQEKRLDLYTESDRKRGFLSSCPPLSRLALLQLGDNVHELVWSIHHVLVDGWCFSILLHEMLDIYEAICRGGEPVFKPSRPFREYVAWLNRQSDDRAEHYWREALKGKNAATTLGLEPCTSPGRAASRYAIGEREIVLPQDLTTAIKNLGQTRRLTLNTLIQGAWSLLLSRYSGQGDVLFGVTVAGRPPELPGVESIVGMFINVLPLRVTVDEETNLLAWLRDLQATMVELRRFEAVPLSRIQAWSQVPLGMPLFESIVIVQNLPFIDSLQERGKQLGIEAARYRERTHYPLSVTVVPGTELAIKIAFDAHRFEPAGIEQILGHLRTVLAAMVVDPERRLADLPLLTEREQQQLEGGANPCPSESYPRDVDLDRLSEEDLDALISRLGTEAGELR